MNQVLSLLYQNGKNVDTVLQEILSVQNSLSTLPEACEYALLNGGKRVRPFLVIESAKLFSLTDKRVLRAAAAIECVHCYSLIHDDLPAMDDDNLRRGMPTVHKKFGEATAILTGDGLLSLAFEILADSSTSKDSNVRANLVLELAKAAGLDGMVAGQMLDLEASKSNSSISLEQIEQLQYLKTGKLLHASVKMGYILGASDALQREKLDSYAKNIGLAFQIADDLLDVLGSAQSMGKKTGKDEGKNKATLVSVIGVVEAKKYAGDLIDKAKKDLDIFGTSADTLRALGDFIIARDR